MSVFSQQFLDKLRQKIDIIEVISPYINLKRAGSSYKAICPFHSEKTPSFMINSGDDHYHCFGCNAHGDAIAFLMNHLKLTFMESVEVLAEKFAVSLEYVDKKALIGPDLSLLRDALNQTSDFFHFHLLHTDEGHLALHYLYRRGIDLEFIRLFKIGFASKNEQLQLDFFKFKKFDKEILLNSSLINQSDNGRCWPFFSNRITFPVLDNSSNVIGFSARKIDEETFGGKYINTRETPIFKKSKILFGLNYSRSRIAKERKAIIVEGQIDALRLIQEGFNFTVASQGTAFGSDHINQLKKLGVVNVYIAFDGDNAGTEASVKVGQLFQSDGIEVSHVLLPEGSDPDLILRKEGPEHFLKYMDNSIDHISMMIRFFSKKFDVDIKTPAGKNRLSKEIATKIYEWSSQLMIHEGLKSLAELLEVPESMIEGEPKKFTPLTTIKLSVNGNQVLEIDLMRWIILVGNEQPQLMDIIFKNLNSEDFIDESCRLMYSEALKIKNELKKLDFLTLARELEEDKQYILNAILDKKVNIDKANNGVITVVQKILERNWMLKSESIKTKIHDGKCSESEILNLAKEFDNIKKNKPEVVIK